MIAEVRLGCSCLRQGGERREEARCKQAHWLRTSSIMAMKEDRSVSTEVDVYQEGVFNGPG